MDDVGSGMRLGEAVMRAGIYLVAASMLYVLFVLTPGGQLADIAVFGPLHWLSESGLVVAGAVRDVLMFTAAVVAVVLAVVALLQGRWRDVMTATAFAVVATGVALVLKAALPRPYFADFGYVENTFPSGRTAAVVAALVAAMWLLQDGRRRHWAVAVFSLVGAAHAFLSVMTFAHRPSDVLGATLLVGGIAALIGFVPSRTTRDGSAAAWAVAAVLIIMGAALLVVWWVGIGDADQAVLVGVGFAQLTVGCVIAVMRHAFDRPLTRARAAERE